MRLESQDIFFHRKVAAIERAVDTVPAIKRARTSSAAAPPSDDRTVGLECLPTLPDISEDMQIAVSGNDGELTRRSEGG